MARPKTITWDKRVAVFLDYRRSGKKVHPVAQRNKIARSTVRVIVKEFEGVGFSAQPRAQVSADLLGEMQEQHIAGLVGLARKGVGRLNLGPGTGNEAGRQDAIADPLPIQDESLWHLRGTKAEQVIEEATNAARDYLRRESAAWQALRLAIEGECHLQEWDVEIRQDPEPHLLPALTRRLHGAFSDIAFRANAPDPSWLRWDLAPDEPEVLRLQGERIGIGSTEDQQRIKEGVTAFLTTVFQEHQRRFSEVERLRQDIGLIDGILDKTLQDITEDDIRRGICPTCPYPEAGQEFDVGPSPRKRSAKKE